MSEAKTISPDEGVFIKTSCRMLKRLYYLAHPGWICQRSGENETCRRGHLFIQDSRARWLEAITLRCSYLHSQFSKPNSCGARRGALENTFSPNWFGLNCAFRWNIPFHKRHLSPAPRNTRLKHKLRMWGDGWFAVLLPSSGYKKNCGYYYLPAIHFYM